MRNGGFFFSCDCPSRTFCLLGGATGTPSTASFITSLLISLADCGKDGLDGGVCFLLEGGGRVGAFLEGILGDCVVGEMCDCVGDTIVGDRITSPDIG